MIKNQNDNGCTDEVGGFHNDGVGWNPQGTFCGECGNASCKDCGNELIGYRRDK